MIDSGNRSLDRDVSTLHETSGNKGNSLQDSTLNSSLEKGIESDLNDKSLAGDIMESEVDSLGGRTSKSVVDSGNDRMLENSGVEV